MGIVNTLHKLNHIIVKYNSKIIASGEQGNQIQIILKPEKCYWMLNISARPGFKFPLSYEIPWVTLE